MGNKEPKEYDPGEGNREIDNEEKRKLRTYIAVVNAPPLVGKWFLTREGWKAQNKNVVFKKIPGLANQ